MIIVHYTPAIRPTEYELKYGAGRYSFLYREPGSQADSPNFVRVTLVPGENVLPQDQVDRLLNDPAFNEFVKNGQVKVFERGEDRPMSAPAAVNEGKRKGKSTPAEIASWEA